MSSRILLLHFNSIGLSDVAAGQL